MTLEDVKDQFRFGVDDAHLPDALKACQDLGARIIRVNEQGWEINTGADGTFLVALVDNLWCLVPTW
jgi:hypothetical protein